MGGTNFSDGTPGATITHYLTNSSGSWILARCAVGSLPTGAGYAVGCIIQLSDGSGMVVNNGTLLVPVWSFIGNLNDVGVLIANGNGTTLVRLGGSPAATTSLTVKAFEVISMDTNGGETITFSNGCTTQNVTVKQGSSGAVTGSTGGSMPVTTAGCLTATSSGSGAYVAKAYFTQP